MEQSPNINRIITILERHGEAALRRLPPETVARQWLDAGFDDPEEVEAWLVARCFNPEGALALDNAGITAEQAAIRTRAGTSGEEDTIGHKLTRGTLGFDEARRIITNHFWNS